MKINFVIFLEVLITLIHGQQQSCSLLASCLEKVKQQADSCSPLVDSVDGIGTTECTQGMTSNKKKDKRK